ncbi:unnamed protein product [Rhizoctonia solani]|uniref:Uncharacterized protein n=1 Tax=Rhizoctonia solani TaxID=456999 RepID=A0A8H2X8N0_9AGAM|nr:unnamed protein product [Rhizoctonia solani]
MASNAQAVVVPNNGVIIRRRPVWGAGGLLAQSVSGLVNVPGLKDVAFFAKEGAKALKAPKLNDVQTRKQIGSIEGLLDRVDSVDAALATSHDLDPPGFHSMAQTELDGVKSFQRNMMGFKSELERALGEKYSTKLARQSDIAQFLAQKNEQVSECVVDFCMDGSIQAHRVAHMHLESNQQMQALSVLLVEQSERMTGLECQIQILQRLLRGCIAFFFLLPQPLYIAVLTG